jgi:hypothetical protein
MQCLAKKLDEGVNMILGTAKGRRNKCSESAMDVPGEIMTMVATVMTTTIIMVRTRRL